MWFQKNNKKINFRKIFENNKKHAKIRISFIVMRAIKHFDDFPRKIFMLGNVIYIWFFRD